MPHREPHKTIYLQWIGVDRDELTESDLSEGAAEVTWCQDKINDTDLEYRLVERKKCDCEGIGCEQCRPREAHAPATPATDEGTCHKAYDDWPGFRGNEPIWSAFRAGWQARGDEATAILREVNGHVAGEIGERIERFLAVAEAAPTPDGWMPVIGTEPPHGAVLLVVIDNYVQHMPAIWDGTEWTWLDACDEADPIPPNKITHWRQLPTFRAGQGRKP